MTGRSLLPALAYFGLVFAAGFVLGTLRVLVFEPRIGEHYAELGELPVMTLISLVAARYVVTRFRIRDRVSAGLTGGVALLILLTIEFTVVLGLRGLSLSDYIVTRQSVVGAAYAVSLLLFALFPLILVTPGSRTQGDHESQEQQP